MDTMKKLFLSLFVILASAAVSAEEAEEDVQKQEAEELNKEPAENFQNAEDSALKDKITTVSEYQFPSLLLAEEFATALNDDDHEAARNLLKHASFPRPSSSAQYLGSAEEILNNELLPRWSAGPMRFEIGKNYRKKIYVLRIYFNGELIDRGNVLVLSESAVVSFESSGGTSVNSQAIADGGKAIEPSPAPEKEGYVFGGWYKEAALTSLWNFDTDTVMANTTLYAKWTGGPTLTDTSEQSGDNQYAFWFIDVDTGKPLSGARVALDGDADVVTDDNGMVVFGTPSYGVHTVSFEKDGYAALQDQFHVMHESILFNRWYSVPKGDTGNELDEQDTKESVTETKRQDAVYKAQVMSRMTMLGNNQCALWFTDADTGEAVSGALIVIDDSVSAVTDDDGLAVFGTPSDGVHTVSFEKDGYAVLQDQFNVTQGTLVFNKYSVPKEMPAQQVKIVLDWDQYPPDLDLHLDKVDDYHLSFEDMQKAADGTAWLDHDVVNGYGPETISITEIDQRASYRVLIHDFSNKDNAESTALAASKAHVRLYTGNRLVNTFEMTSGKSGVSWDVFEIVNGTIKLLDVGQ